MTLRGFAARGLKSQRRWRSRRSGMYRFRFDRSLNLEELDGWQHPNSNRCEE
jgi:hypothetical protein